MATVLAIVFYLQPGEPFLLENSLYLNKQKHLLQRSTIQLLRFQFSYFLMPVFWFAISFVEEINIVKTVLAFIILHLVVYPSSNGYNSYMDRDETSIGGIKDPLQPTKQLYLVTVIMDATALFISSFISLLFTVCILCYIVCSRLYSYRGIRLKRLPIIGYITVILNQGALTFFMVYHAGNKDPNAHAPVTGLVAAAFLIGGFYPITQVYQHESDKKDGVTTISMLLGKRGTFIFCAALYAIALAILFSYYMHQNHTIWFGVLQIFFVPVLVYFVWWFTQVVKNDKAADFKHTMRMNWIASTCTSLAFITLILFNQFG
jgi:1,4-dihydroxy-2-naphthoate polyprenyltransferase